jgi:hypothetical protein
MREACRLGLFLAAVALAGWASLAAPGEPAPAKRTALRFEVTLKKGLLPAPRDGRLLVVLAGEKKPQPRESIGEVGRKAPPLLGRDVKGLAAGVAAVVDDKAAIFPLRHLADLPRGDYFAQAVFVHNRDLKLHDAPGNLFSEPVKARLDPAAGGAVKLELTRQVPAEDVPAEDAYVKYVKVRSGLLSKFHGRPIYLRAGVILPADYGKDKGRRYPLRVHVGGYGTRFTEVKEKMRPDSAFRKLWLSKDAPRMVLLHLDGAGPFGDPYQVNSANNGPYGDAVTQELIPLVERRFGLIGRPYARVLDGASTGGWVSLALQVFYPDFFNGTWSHCPDPVDFRAYEVINLYKDDNAYVNAHGFERPAARDLNGDVRTTVRHECRLEAVLGLGDNWALSGKDWAAWNAVFGPRGADSLPRPAWDGTTGKIDKGVRDHWQKYDLRLVLEKDWRVLGPKLRGKLRVWVGEADEYFLNNAVHLLDAFLKKARPAYEGKITYGMGQGHDWRGLSEKEMMAEMAAAVERGRRAAEGRGER